MYLVASFSVARLGDQQQEGVDEPLHGRYTAKVAGKMGMAYFWDHTTPLGNSS